MAHYEGLAAIWEVRAGVIPGVAVPELTKRFLYTSRDKQEDTEHASEIGYQPLFMKQLVCAAAYCQQMCDPRVNNWADMTFMWF